METSKKYYIVYCEIPQELQHKFGKVKFLSKDLKTFTGAEDGAYIFNEDSLKIWMQRNKRPNYLTKEVTEKVNDELVKVVENKIAEHKFEDEWEG